MDTQATEKSPRPSNTTGDALGTRKHRLAILIRINRRCPVCKRRIQFGGACRKSKLTIDHLVAWVTGGSNCAGNLVPLCGSCNSSKKDKVLADWLEARLVSVGRASSERGAKSMLPREIEKLNKLAAVYAAILEA